MVAEADLADPFARFAVFRALAEHLADVPVELDTPFGAANARIPSSSPFPEHRAPTPDDGPPTVPRRCRSASHRASRWPAGPATWCPCHTMPDAVPYALGDLRGESGRQQHGR
jgi:hypothetical protein